MGCDQSIRLMIVDANPGVQEGLSTFIGTLHDMCLVASATCGSEAIEGYREHRPNVILLDQVLPDMSGTELVQVLLKEDQNLEFTLLQGTSDPNGQKLPILPERTHVLHKSVSGAKIAKTIRRVVNGKRNAISVGDE